MEEIGYLVRNLPRSVCCFLIVLLLLFSPIDDLLCPLPPTHTAVIFGAVQRRVVRRYWTGIPEEVEISGDTT